MRAQEGEWSGPRQLILVGNLDQGSVELTDGDVLGAVLFDASDCPESEELPGVAHVWQDWDTLLDISELEVPPATYYAALGASLKERYPSASKTVTEHLEALEAFLDVCIVSGYSLGAAKSLGCLMQPSLESLGEVCGRDGAQACEHHDPIIKEWGDIPDVSALRRFLGTSNWVRQHFLT